MSNLPPLVDAAWLADHLDAPDLRILDIRSGPDADQAFEAGHIPGAVRADYATAGWRAQVGAAPGMLPSAEALSTLLGGLGITPQSDVVVVSAGDLSTAARIHWTLKAVGHPSVALLDGGMAAWAAANGAVEKGPSEDVAGPDYPVQFDVGVRALRDAVETSVSDRGSALIDSRSASDFLGETKSPHAARFGRLPGAVHVDEAQLVDPTTKRLRSREELETIMTAAPAGPAIVYCNTGQAAASDWFVLSEILGRPDVRLYDGSMTDWTQDPDRPVETGPNEAGPKA